MECQTVPVAFCIGWLTLNAIEAKVKSCLFEKRDQGSQKARSKLGKVVKSQ